MRIGSQICIMMVSFVWGPCSNATSAYFDGHETGWYWYDEAPVMAPQKPDVPSEQVASPPSASRQLAHLQQQLEEAKAKAVLYPTQANIAHYVVWQNKMASLASRFANGWQQVLLERPALNYNIMHPTSQVGVQMMHDVKRQEVQAVMKQFSRTRGLFFFYHAHCPYCKRFAPILKRFSERYGVPILPVTLDGEKLPEFPETRLDAGQAREFGVDKVPAVFSVNPKTGEAVPVGYGLMSWEDLEKRLVALSKEEPAS